MYHIVEIEIIIVLRLNDSIYCNENLVILLLLKKKKKKEFFLDLFVTTEWISFYYFFHKVIDIPMLGKYYEFVASIKFIKRSINLARGYTLSVKTNTDRLYRPKWLFNWCACINNVNIDKKLPGQWQWRILKV